ncbi:MAG: hypothetical protein QOE06_183 [Thermoleophilaceae bacterium]|nr:hypothetical protein [Thermoleophilaceae bacterium]
MLKRKTLTLVVLVASFALLAPAAFAHPGQSGARHHGDNTGSRSGGYSPAPSRVTTRLKRAARSLDLAQTRVDDGDNSGAISALASVRKNLASAHKSANARVSAAAANGPASANAVTVADDDVVTSTVSLFDGVTDSSVVNAIAQTLDGALTGRDGTVDAIAALTAAQQADYYYVLEGIDQAIDDEVASIDDALANDTLTADAKAALSDAKTKAQATQTKVKALLATLEANGTTSNQTTNSSGTGRNCPKGTTSNAS